MPYFLKDNYYADIDQHNQLRITGPGNHLLLGITFPKSLPPVVERVRELEGDLVLKLAFAGKKLAFSIPVVTDIRTIRRYTEGVKPKLTYKDLVKQNITDVIPETVVQTETEKSHIITFRNIYYDENGEERYYGAKIRVSKDFALRQSGRVITVEGKKQVRITIRTVTNISIAEKIESPIFASGSMVLRDKLSPFLHQLYKESRKNVEFLVRTKKTSSFEYGTIFPRDWIESADLGQDDLTQETIDYMYRQSMRKISRRGEAWHEDIIGHFRQKVGGDESIHIDRKMIDIEPRYIMGVPHVSNQFLLHEDNRKKLLLVSRYILENAKRKELISFKMRPGKGTGYYIVGNWRDSGNAFPSQKVPLSPYDVNCVFYPTALRILLDFSDYFQIKKREHVEKLLSKWEHNKEVFRMFHPKGIVGYALAVHGKKNRPMPIAHLDESYDLFYDRPSMQDIVSFAKKLVDPKFFYTEVGPLLVASDEEEFTTQMYHGKVIWPKQAAYAIAGLARQYRRGREEQWPEPILHQIRGSVLVTCESCFRGWHDLGFVPELYYYDKKKKKARLYVDQKKYEGQMSNIQLWSSVGVRRIIREYLALH